ncbi:MAG: toll/interleukin-1 receptor domain-containing protein [Candidatus Limnocylindria bacterium]
MSYSRKDADVVRRLVSALERSGHDVWVDVDDIPVGTWAAQIVQAIRGSDLVLLVLSPASVASSEVPKEVSLAASRHVPIVPIVLGLPGEIPGEIAYHIAGQQRLTIDAKDTAKGIQAVVRAIDGTVPASSVDLDLPTAHGRPAVAVLEADVTRFYSLVRSQIGEPDALKVDVEEVAGRLDPAEEVLGVDAVSRYGAVVSGSLIAVTTRRVIVSSTPTILSALRRRKVTEMAIGDIASIARTFDVDDAILTFHFKPPPDRFTPKPAAVVVSKHRSRELAKLIMSAPAYAGEIVAGHRHGTITPPASTAVRSQGEQLYCADRSSYVRWCTWQGIAPHGLGEVQDAVARAYEKGGVSVAWYEGELYGESLRGRQSMGFGSRQSTHCEPAESIDGGEVAVVAISSANPHGRNFVDFGSNERNVRRILDDVRKGGLDLS